MILLRFIVSCISRGHESAALFIIRQPRTLFNEAGRPLKVQHQRAGFYYSLFFFLHVLRRAKLRVLQNAFGFHKDSNLTLPSSTNKNGEMISIQIWPLKPLAEMNSFGTALWIEGRAS